MKRFKIGDRVRLISIDGDYNSRLKIGATGVIKNFYNGSYDYKVEFDEYFNGHSCGGVCKDGHGQNIYDKDLELESTTIIKGEIMATNEVIKIYTDKKEKQLNNKYEALLENAKLNDPIYKSFREHADALLEIYNAQKMTITLTEPKLSDDTSKVIENLMTDKNKEYDELKEYINEVSAQLSMCETYEQRKDILKTYNIIGKDGKIKA